MPLTDKQPMNERTDTKHSNWILESTQKSPYLRNVQQRQTTYFHQHSLGGVSISHTVHMDQVQYRGVT